MSTAGARVLVCDDATGLRLIVQKLLEDAGFLVCATGSTWSDAVHLTAEHRPDVVLVDLWMPHFEAEELRRVRQLAPDAVLAVVSSHSPEEMRNLLRGVAEASIVLSKHEIPDRLVSEMHRVLAARGANVADSPALGAS